jgi:hypothetical protein
MTTPSPIQKMAVRYFREVQANDDRLGQYSDHEGNEDGPSFFLWTQGYTTFKKHCERSIRDHEKAIETMKKLQKLNEARKPC